MIPNNLNSYVPRVTGPNREKMAFFRENPDFQPFQAGHAPIGRYPFRVHVKFSNRSVSNSGSLVINEVEAINSSANKLKTYRKWKGTDVPYNICFPATQFIVKATTPDGADELDLEMLERNLPYPFVAKRILGEKKKGFYKINNDNDLIEFCRTERISNYLFEEYFEFTREYRIHVSPWLKSKSMVYGFPSNGKTKVICNKDGVIVMVKKKMKNNSEETILNRSSNDNVVFSTNYQSEDWMVEARKLAVKAIELLGLDFGAIDVGYNSSTGEYRFFESNSNPGMDSMTAICYQQALKEIILAKGIAKKLTLPITNQKSTLPKKSNPKRILLKKKKTNVKGNFKRFQ